MDSTDVSVTMALETDESPVLGFNHRATPAQPPGSVGPAGDQQGQPTCWEHRERENIPQDLVLSGGEYLQGRRLHNLPG